MNPNERLSQHFTLYEMIKSSTAGRFDIDNKPSRLEIRKLRNLCINFLEPVRELFGSTSVRVNSGFRCLELNRAIGSKDYSQHVFGEAVDFEIPGISNASIYKEIIESGIVYDQLILEFHKDGVPSSGWVHGSLLLPNRQQHLIIG